MDYANLDGKEKTHRQHDMRVFCMTSVLAIFEIE